MNLERGEIFPAGSVFRSRRETFFRPSSWRERGELTVRVSRGSKVSARDTWKRLKEFTPLIFRTRTFREITRLVSVRRYLCRFSLPPPAPASFQPEVSSRKLEYILARNSSRQNAFSKLYSGAARRSPSISARQNGNIRAWWRRGIPVAEARIEADLRPGILLHLHVLLLKRGS